jgi:hypothetical protein
LGGEDAGLGIAGLSAENGIVPYDREDDCEDVSHLDVTVGHGQEEVVEEKGEG